MDDNIRTEVEAAVLRRLVHHFRRRTDVQNIDLMTLAGFCRNCLAKWYRAAAREHDVELSYDEAREIIYGAPYAEWKKQHQKESTDAQVAGYKASLDEHGEAGEHWFDEAV